MTASIVGYDTAGTLSWLVSLLGWGELSLGELEVERIEQVTAGDRAAAREVGCAIKPIVFAERGRYGVEAFAGAALLSVSEPLAALDGSLSGLRLDGLRVSNLFFSGPTAALLGQGQRRVLRPYTDVSGPNNRPLSAAARVRAPITPWLVRMTFPGVVPSADTVGMLAVAAGFDVARRIAGPGGESRWLVSGLHSRQQVDHARAYLRRTHRIETLTVRPVLNPNDIRRTAISEPRTAFSD